jgi:hypothetical protein
MAMREKSGTGTGEATVNQIEPGTNQFKLSFVQRNYWNEEVHVYCVF